MTIHMIAANRGTVYAARRVHVVAHHQGAASVVAGLRKAQGRVRPKGEVGEIEVVRNPTAGTLLYALSGKRSSEAAHAASPSSGD